MTNTYNQLKKELSVLYPDVTDKELNQMTSNLIDFYTMLVQAASDLDNAVEKNQNLEDTTSDPYGKEVNSLKNQ